uniref:Ankyrin repeat protein n=1 Tax=Trichogramma kaykai TaxID=54128 RepID=A0ABD2X3X8_9HYME
MAESNQKYLKKFKGNKPQKVNQNIEEKSHEFLRKLYPFIRDYDGQLPNILDIFQPKAIEWLLSESVKSNNSVIKAKPLIDFFINTGYKDEPEVDQDDKPFSRRTTPLHHAGKRDASIVPDLFKIYDRFDVNYTNEDGLTHFHVACNFDCVDVVEKFLELGQDPNCLVTKTGDSPLHLALDWYRHKKIAELLLRAGADLNLANVDGVTPLHKICLNHDELLEMFFNINEDKHQTVQIDAQDKDSKTPLH